MANFLRNDTNIYTKRGVKTNCDLGVGGITEAAEDIDKKVTKFWELQFDGRGQMRQFPTE